MSSIEVFKKYYKNEKNNIEEKINKFNDELVIEDNKIIRENLELFKTLNSEGKIIRGTLVNLGYYLLKDNKEYSYDLSLAYELFQTSILIHDDIIDNDSKRRGHDTIHFANYNKYNNYSKDKNELKHLSESIAICIGDYGLYLANQQIVSSYKNDVHLGEVLTYFNDTVLKTIKGEILDVILPFTSKNNLLNNEEITDSIMNIYKLKTSYYTIIGPMVCGMLLAGTTEEEIKDIEEFGTLAGIAFQIQDDILGIYSNEMGKVKGSDIKEFKSTILFSHAITTSYKDELLKYYGKEDISEENINRVQDIFKESKSLDYANNIMNEMYDKSLDKLNNINWIKEDKKQLLEGFIEYLRNRNK